jgi:transcription antitermination factor NusB
MMDDGMNNHGGQPEPQNAPPVKPTREDTEDSLDNLPVPAWAKKLRRDFSRAMQQTAQALETAPQTEDAVFQTSSATSTDVAEEIAKPVSVKVPGQLSGKAEIRRLAVVTLFSLDLSQAEIGAGEMIQRLEAMVPGAAEWPDEVFHRCKAYLDNSSVVDKDIRDALRNWTIERLGAMERAILRVGAAELRFCPDIPPKVTINECIELAKDYCEPVSYKLINGVLDTIRKSVGKTDFEVRRSNLPKIRHRRQTPPPSNADFQPSKGEKTCHG